MQLRDHEIQCDDNGGNAERKDCSEAPNYSLLLHSDILPLFLQEAKTISPRVHCMQHALAFKDMHVLLPADSHYLYGFMKQNNNKETNLFVVVVKKKDKEIPEDAYATLRSHFITDLHQYSRDGQGWRFNSSRPLRYSMPVPGKDPVLFEEATAAIVVKRSSGHTADVLYLSFIVQSYDARNDRTVRNDSVLCWLDLDSLPATLQDHQVEELAIWQLWHYQQTAVLSLRSATLNDHSLLVVHLRRCIFFVSVRLYVACLGHIIFI